MIHVGSISYSFCDAGPVYEYHQQNWKQMHDVPIQSQVYCSLQPVLFECVRAVIVGVVRVFVQDTVVEVKDNSSQDYYNKKHILYLNPGLISLFQMNQSILFNERSCRITKYIENQDQDSLCCKWELLEFRKLAVCKLSKKQQERLAKKKYQIGSPNILTIIFNYLQHFKIIRYIFPILHGQKTAFINTEQYSFQPIQGIKIVKKLIINEHIKITKVQMDEKMTKADVTLGYSFIFSCSAVLLYVLKSMLIYVQYMMILIIPLKMETIQLIHVQDSHRKTRIKICMQSLPNSLLYYCDLRCLSNFLNC